MFLYYQVLTKILVRCSSGFETMFTYSILYAVNKQDGNMFIQLKTALVLIKCLFWKDKRIK